MHTGRWFKTVSFFDVKKLYFVMYKNEVRICVEFIMFQKMKK